MAVGLGGDEVAGTLEGEEDLSIMTTETGIMIQETGHQIAHTGRAVDRLYGEIVIFETSETSTGEIVMIVGFQGSTTLTSDLLALRSLGQELWTPTAGPGRLTLATARDAPAMRALLPTTPADLAVVART